MLVPQEGFLFDDTLAANVRYGRLDATEDDILASADELGLGDWVAGLPHGLDTRVGQRGESLSAGERQLVALLRAHLADPDLLVLDEATSAVDPALEMRIGRALERLMSGPHLGHHRPPALHRRERRRGGRRRPAAGSSSAARTRDLVGQEGVYAGLHASWVAQQGPDRDPEPEPRDHGSAGALSSRIRVASRAVLQGQSVRECARAHGSGGRGRRQVPP